MSISDIIEAFLLETLGEDDSLNISRNELASYFSVAPSQINYVLSTRFTPNKGYVIESHRGGGGFITVVRLSGTPHSILNEIINNSPAVGYTQNGAFDVLERMTREKLISTNEFALLKSVMSDNALTTPTQTNKNVMRASMLKELARQLLKRQ